jgi:hypothetical protein
MIATQLILAFGCITQPTDIAAPEYPCNVIIGLELIPENSEDCKTARMLSKVDQPI